MKATHSGHCQACGSLQKLPNGKLAKHGYTTKWGFFAGVCAGSGRLPYELSCTYIQDCITSVSAQKMEATVERDALLISATEPKGWVHHSVYSKNTGRSSSTWKLVTIDAETHTLESGYTYCTFTYTIDGQSFKTCEYGKAQNALEAATICNANYARTFTKRIAEMAQYVSWQQTRVNDWKLAPLVPAK